MKFNRLLTALAATLTLLLLAAPPAARAQGIVESPVGSGNYTATGTFFVSGFDLAGGTDPTPTVDFAASTNSSGSSVNPLYRVGGSNYTINVAAGAFIQNTNFAAIFEAQSGAGLVTYNIDGTLRADTRAISANFVTPPRWDINLTGTIRNDSPTSILLLGQGGADKLTLQSTGTLQSNGGSINFRDGSNEFVINGGTFNNLAHAVFGSGNDLVEFNATPTGSTQLLGGDGTDTVRLNNSGSYSLTAIESGWENLEMNGTAWTLSGTTANTFTGGTALNSGTLTLDVTSGTTTLDGTVSGPGSLTKDGPGTLTLSAANTYTGATNVNAGTLALNGSIANSLLTVNNGGTLAGTGTAGGNVVITSGGTLAPGNSPGILNIVGDLTLNSGSTSNFEINGTTPGTLYDQVVVGGTATLGGTLNLLFGFTPSNGDTFTLIDAATITGDFDSVVNSLGNALVFTTSITDDYILNITAVQTSFATTGFTGDDPELIAIANVLDNNFSDPGLLSLINALNGLPGTSLEDALQLINPDELTALSGFTFHNTRNAVMRLGNRLRALRNGAGGGIDTSGFSLFDASGQFRSNTLLADTALVAPPGLQIMEPAIQNDPRLGMFVSGSGTFGDYDGDANGAGFDYDAAAVLIGADYRTSETSAVGFYAGYDRTDANLGNNGGTADADTARFGVTGTWWAPQVLSSKNDVEGRVYVEAQAGGAHHWYETDRNGFGGTASGDTRGVELSASGAIGYEIRKDGFAFGPELSLNYTNLWTDGFTETGSLAPLAIGADTRGSLTTTAGGRISYSVQLSAVSIQPYAHAGWRHEYLGTAGSTSARFANGAGGVFNANGSNQSRDSIVAGAGVVARFNEVISAELGYTGEGSTDTEIHSINGSVTMNF
jgi:autotransporter-associated beta strand protein